MNADYAKELNRRDQEAEVVNQNRQNLENEIIKLTTDNASLEE